MRLERPGAGKDLDGDRLAVQSDCCLDGAVGRADKVIAVAALYIAVICALAACIARVQYFEEVKLAAPGCPAGAVSGAVLERAWNLCVEHPDCRHVHIPARGPIVGHVELEHEELLGTAEAIFLNVSTPIRAVAGKDLR